MKPAHPFLALAVTALVAACASTPPAKTGEDTAAPPPDAMSKAELCDHIGQRICKRCVPEGVEECTTGYQQTCGDDAKTTQVSPEHRAAATVAPEEKPSIALLTDHEIAREPLADPVGRVALQQGCHAEQDHPVGEDRLHLGPLWGLNRARAHFTDRRSLESFVPPAFAVVEITGLPFFDDANLVNHKFEEVQAEVGKMIA